MMDRSGISRRGFVGCGVAALLPATFGTAPASAAPLAAFQHGSGINPRLVDRALAAMARHSRKLVATDRIAIADFSMHSVTARFHLIDFERGSVRNLLVAHGRGSDPAHSGWLHHFSNIPGSEATSSGTYVTGQSYIGEHGRSMRLNGLDSSNSTAEERAIVIHAAWYVDPAMAKNQGKIGRSQGCLAVSPDTLDPLLSWLGTGRMIYADRV